MVNDMAGTSRAARRSEHGSSLIELALVLPLLSLVLLGTADFGRVFYQAQAVTAAARIGTLYGAQSVAKSGDTSGMNATARNAAYADVGSITATSAEICECVKNDASGWRTVACTATCTASEHLGVTASVTTSKTFSMTSPFPGLPYTVPLTRTASMRSQ